MGSLSAYRAADSPPCLGRPRQKDHFSRMGWLFAVSAARGVHGADRCLAGPDYPQHCLLGHRLSVSSLEMGVCGDRDRLRELRANGLRSRMGEPPVVAAWIRTTPERADSQAGVREFLVRAS